MAKNIFSDVELAYKIFHHNGNETDIGEFLCTMFSKDVSVNTKKFLWDLWANRYYSFDDIREFFSDTLFKEDGGETYMDIMLKCDNYNNFYDLAFNLDIGNFDPVVYYIYWILTFGKQTDKKVLEDAIEYDQDTILGLFPDIKKVLF